MSADPKTLVKGVVRAIGLPLARRAARSPHLKRLARAFLARMPALEQRARALLHRPDPPPPRRMHVPLASDDLSPAAQEAYLELKRQFEAKPS